MITESRYQTNKAVDYYEIADRCLLSPYNIDASGLQQVLGQILAHKIDYADMYFQYSRSEGWMLEEGIVKSGSFNIEQGVGVRAISGDKTALPIQTISVWRRWNQPQRQPVRFRVRGQSICSGGCKCADSARAVALFT